MCVRLVVLGLVLVLFSAKIMPGAERNGALNKPTVASSTLVSSDRETYVSANAFDGDITTLWNGGRHGSTFNPVSLWLDLEEQFSIRRIFLTSDPGIRPGGEGYFISYRLYASSDFESWSLVGSGILVDTNDPEDELFFGDGIVGDELKARYLRFDVVGGTHYAHLEEIQVMASPPGIPDIIAESLTWNTVSGGVDFTYRVTGATLERDTHAALYWANGDTIVPPSSSPPFVTIPMSTELNMSVLEHVPATALGLPPEGATHLLLEVDSD